MWHEGRMFETPAQARKYVRTPNFFAPLEKCVGHSLKLHSLKNLGPSQKTLRPS